MKPESLRDLLEGCEWIFHAAGYYPPFRERRERAIERAIDSTRRILGEFRRAPAAKVVFTSSAATIRAVPGGQANEESEEPWPLTEWRPLYSSVKIAMEQEALRFCREGDPIVIVNPSICIGEYDARPFSGRVVLAFSKYKVPWTVETSFNVVYTGDVGVGHLRAAEKGRCGQRYLLAGHNVSLQEFAELVARLAGVRPPRWKIPYSAALFGARTMGLYARFTRTQPLVTIQEVRRVRGGYSLDGSKAIRELGCLKTPIEEAVRRALLWFKENGFLE